ncbi:MAG: PKD domain-containing protein [Planctomycetes bacterium]|nr:PKD domain-containing protein [Planctomycetota bacterium]
MARVILLALLAAGGLLGGCPQLGTTTPAVNAVAAVSSTRGSSPLRVSVSGDSSTARSGSIVRYSWDFAGLGSAEGVTADFIFANPGTYTITLTVEDEAGNTDIDRVDVQVQGSTAEAVIVADRTSGPAPLIVHFDGLSSNAVDDTIRDYYWTFGDGESSRDSQPVHIYSRVGEFNVTLRVVSGGGIEDEASIAIKVSDAAEATLQFNGSQLATLSSGTSDPLSAFTLEAMLKADNDGGPVAAFGSPSISLEVSPSAGRVRLRVAGQTFDETTAISAGEWTFVALRFDAASGFTVYLGSRVVLTAAYASNVTIGDITLGAGFRGNLGRVRLWSTVRDDSELALDAAGTVSAGAGELLGDWPIDDGAGQTLRNRAAGGQPGLRGASTALETNDPAWSSDAP